MDILRFQALWKGYRTGHLPQCLQIPGEEGLIFYAYKKYRGWNQMFDPGRLKGEFDLGVRITA
ncbi:MAG: hypothetical protein JWQ57_905 [Mucilaginibacter sp.]|nr:hypothetical protein [Mucilaginibacter sp.]